MQNLIDIPEKCLAYSANWYMSEISKYDEESNLFAFGSNSDIYIINYQDKKYETIIYNNNMREKISCVQMLIPKNSSQTQSRTDMEAEDNQSEDIIIFAGCNSGTLYIFEYNPVSKKSRQIESQNLVQNQTIISINVDKNQFNPYLPKLQVFIQNGSTFNLQYDHLQKKIVSMRLFIQQSKYNLKLKLQSLITTPAQIQKLDEESQTLVLEKSNNTQESIHFFEEGQVIIYENNTQIMSHQIEGKILTIDELPSDDIENESKKYVLLKKIKNYLFLNIIELSLNKQDKTNQDIAETENNSLQKDEVQDEQIADNELKENPQIGEQIEQSKNSNTSVQQPNIKKYKIKSVLDIELFLIYAKKHNDLVQSSFTIRSLDEDNFILTGKMGDMYIFNSTKLIKFGKKNSKVTINPLSAQFNDTFYTKVPDSNHYDGIFAIQLSSSYSKLITLSTDRRISFFNIKKHIISNEQQEEQIINEIQAINEQENNFNEEEKNDNELLNNQNIPYFLEFEWQLNCLGAKINSLVTSEVEKELVYMSCLDHTVRVWDSSKTHDQLYVKEYYKRIDQYSVKQMILHPIFENVMVLFLEDNPKKLVGYDLFKEKVSFEYTSNRDILNLRWLNKDLAEELQNILFEQSPTQKKNNESEGTERMDKPAHKQIKMDKDRFDVKEKGLLTQNDDCNLLIFKKGGYISLLDLSEGTVCVEDYSICENKNNVQQFEFEIIDNQIFAVFAQIGCISFYSDYQYKQFQNMHKNVVKSIAFKQTQDNQLLIACACLDRRVSVYYGNPSDVSSFNFVTYLRHDYPIEVVRFSPLQDCYYLLSIAQNHNTLQVYNLDPSSISQILNSALKNSSVLNNDEQEQEEDEDNDENQIKEDKSDQNNGQTTQKSLPSLEYKNIRGHRGYINDAVFSPLDSNLIITCSDDQTVKFWKIDAIANKSYPKRKKNKNSKGQSSDNNFDGVEENNGQQKKQGFNQRFNKPNHNNNNNGNNKNYHSNSGGNNQNKSNNQNWNNKNNYNSKKSYNKGQQNNQQNHNNNQNNRK